MTESLPKRKPLRLREFDYTRDGAYFVTICTHLRQPTLGEIKGGRVCLSELGRIAEQCWKEIPAHFADVVTDEFVVMPNHVHGILFIQHEEAGTACRAPTEGEFGQVVTQEGFGKPVSGSLPTIVRSYKAAVTKMARESVGVAGDLVWQRGFHERVIRRDSELFNVRKYIIENLLSWEMDPENPKMIR